ncbi:MAG: hypothetical protein ACXV8M_02180, partial [Candidatus Angelobacter sp.]
TKLHVSDRRDVMYKEQVQPFMVSAPPLKKSSRSATMKSKRAAANAHRADRSAGADDELMPARSDSTQGG